MLCQDLRSCAAVLRTAGRAGWLVRPKIEMTGQIHLKVDMLLDEITAIHVSYIDKAEFQDEEDLHILV